MIHPGPFLGCKTWFQSRFTLLPEENYIDPRTVMCVTLPTFGSAPWLISSLKARYRRVRSATPGYFHNSESAVPEQQQSPVNN